MLEPITYTTDRNLTFPPKSPIFGPFLLWPNGWMHQDATWYGCRPQPRGLCVRWKPSSPPQKGGGDPPPKFSAHVYCGQMPGWIKMPLGTKVGLSPGDSVLNEDPVPSPQIGWSPLSNFRPTSIVAKWLDASRCHLVYGGRPQLRGLWVRWGPIPPPKREAEAGAGPPIFGPWLLWPNGWMNQDGTWHGGRPWSVQSTLCKMGTQLPSLKQG